MGLVRTLCLKPTVNRDWKRRPIRNIQIFHVARTVRDRKSKPNKNRNSLSHPWLRGFAHSFQKKDRLLWYIIRVKITAYCFHYIEGFKHFQLTFCHLSQVPAQPPRVKIFGLNEVTLSLVWRTQDSDSESELSGEVSFPTKCWFKDVLCLRVLWDTGRHYKYLSVHT